VADQPEGYPQLAAFLYSDDNFAIFRKFGQLNCRVLLHLQAEITALQEELADLDRSDACEGSTTSYRLQSCKHQEGWDTRQRDTIHQLQGKLAIYCNTLSKAEASP